MHAAGRAEQATVALRDREREDTPELHSMPYKQVVLTRETRLYCARGAVYAAIGRAHYSLYGSGCFCKNAEILS